MEPRSLTALIVEDDEPTQNLIEAVLRRHGYATEIASDATQAMAMLEARDDYAVVVLDIMMPTVSGRDVVAFLARSAKSIPVVVCSAAGPRALDDFDPRVVKAVVRKPFDIAQFMEAIDRVTGASKHG